MNRQLLVTGVLVASLFGGLSACSSSDDKPETKPTATKATTTTTATPTPAPQPKGADGVMYEIQNWDKYADDPAVLGWKQALEAINASANAGRVLPAARAGMSKRVLRQYLPAVRAAWDRDWHVLPVAKVKVETVRTIGAKARLTTCLWGPSTGFYKQNGKFFGKPEAFWLRQKVDLVRKSGTWVLSTVTFDGKCSGGEPA